MYVKYYRDEATVLLTSVSFFPASLYFLASSAARPLAAWSFDMVTASLLESGECSAFVMYAETCVKLPSSMAHFITARHMLMTCVDVVQ